MTGPSSFDYAIKNGGAKFSEVGGPTMVGSDVPEKFLDFRSFDNNFDAICFRLGSVCV